MSRHNQRTRSGSALCGSKSKGRIHVLEATHKTEEAQKKLERLISDFKPRKEHTQPRDVVRAPDSLS